MKARHTQINLQFKFHAGTSRGVLLQKPSSFLILEQDGFTAIGECSTIPDLSIDPMELYEQKLNEVCEECIPMPDPEEKVKLNSLLNEIKPQVIATDMSQLDSEFIAVSHQHNSKVFVDENSGNEEEWKNIIDINCDGIQTDDPEKLINFLKKK